MIADSRTRAAALLLLVFVVGAVAGAAADRRIIRPPTAVERRARAAAADSANIDRIPVPLEQLGLTDSETDRLRAIAHSWRPRALVAFDTFRARVTDLENGMFAEMLCALPAAKRDRYVAQLRGAHYDEQIIAKRTALIRSNQCPAGSRK